MNKPKILNKFKSKESKEKSSVMNAPTGRVTNDTVSEHRDAILKKGREFKYPFQHSKHKIVIISLTLTSVALVLLGMITALQLYKRQSTSDFAYRVSQIIPFPVAKVNGEFVSYESYLFTLSPNINWLYQHGTTDLNSEDGKRQIKHFKRASLDRALEDQIARGLAEKHGITVDGAKIDKDIEDLRARGGDLEQIIFDSYNFRSIQDFRRADYSGRLRLEVARQLDKEAPERAKKILSEIKAGKPFADVAKVYSEDLETKPLGGDIGIVEKGRANLPEEVADKVFAMKSGDVSDVISTSSDYFIINVTEKLDDKRAKISIIRIKIKDISQYLKEYRLQKKVSEYIKLENIETE